MHVTAAQPRQKKNRVASLFAKEVGAPLLLLRLISQINISFTALGLYFDELEQTRFFPLLLNLESDPTAAFFFFFLERNSLPRCVSGSEHLVSKVN